MNLAKISANGQVTVPMEIRKKLSLKAGDKLLFMEYRGHIVLGNASLMALQKAQEAFSGVAKAIDVKNDDDVQNLVNAVRYGADG